MEDIPTFDLMLLISNTEYALLSGTGQFTESQQRLSAKLKKELKLRKDYDQALEAHQTLINLNP